MSGTNIVEFVNLLTVGEDSVCIHWIYHVFLAMPAIAAITTFDEYVGLGAVPGLAPR